MVCKITDFGFSTIIDKRKKSLSIGSPMYMAPEVISRMYDSKADIWALGVIAYILLTGKSPFEGKDNDAMFVQIRYGIIDKECLSHYTKEGKYVKDFIIKTLNRNPNARHCAAELLQHKWFKKLVINHEIPEEELVDTGLNIYTFK